MKAYTPTPCRRRCTVSTIKVERGTKDSHRKSVVVEYGLEVPDNRLLTQANGKDDFGVSKEEVALASRAFYQSHHHDEMLLEKIDGCRSEQGWELMGTPSGTCQSLCRSSYYGSTVKITVG